MPKADRMFGLSRLMEQCNAVKYAVICIVIILMLVWWAAYLGDAATSEDLERDLAVVVGIEYYSIDEIMVAVGPAWGYNVSRDGIVTLDDGEFDLMGGGV